MNRYNRRKVVLNSAGLGAKPIVGYFRTSDVDGFAGALAAAFDAKVVKDGDAIELPGPQRLVAQASLISVVPVDHLEIVRNGEVVASLPLDEGGTTGGGRVELEVPASGWYLLRAWNSSARHPVLDQLPFATTSPIYVEVGARPVRSADWRAATF